MWMVAFVFHPICFKRMFHSFHMSLCHDKNYIFYFSFLILVWIDEFYMETNMKFNKIKCLHKWKNLSSLFARLFYACVSTCLVLCVSLKLLCNWIQNHILCMTILCSIGNGKIIVIFWYGICWMVNFRRIEFDLMDFEGFCNLNVGGKENFWANSWGPPINYFSLSLSWTRKAFLLF